MFLCLADEISVAFVRFSLAFHALFNVSLTGRRHLQIGSCGPGTSASFGRGRVEHVKRGTVWQGRETCDESCGFVKEGPPSSFHLQRE